MGRNTISFDIKNLLGASIELNDDYMNYLGVGVTMNTPDRYVTPQQFNPKRSTKTYAILDITENYVENLTDSKTLIKVENDADPNFTYVVDPSTPKVTNKYNLWSGNDVQLYVGHLSTTTTDTNIKVTIYNTDGSKDYTKPDIIPTKIIYNLTNVQEPTLKETTLNGDILTLNVIEGFEFTTPPVAKFDGKEINFTVNEDKTIATIQLSKENFDVENLTKIEIIAVAEEPQIPITYKLQYCTVQGIPPETISSNDPQLSLTLVCNEGYIFKSNPWLEFTTEPYNDYKKIVGVISEDKTTATLELKEFVFGTLISFIVQGTASVKPIETTIASNLTTIYKVDNDILKDISLIRFRQPDETLIEILGGELNRKYMIDLTNYIISLKHFFIDIPATQAEYIKIGFMQTEIDSPVVPYDNLTIDLGNIEIIGEQDNINDYSNTVVSAYLAFIGLVTLDSVLTVNKTINVRYEVNLYNGDCQVFLTNNDNVIVYMGSCNISADIPYIYNSDRNVNNQLNFYSSMNFMQDLESYFLVRKKIPVNSSLNLVIDNKETVVGNEQGLNYFTDFQIEFIADKQEKIELSNLLETGIII